MDSSRLEPGTVLAGKYQIGLPLGEGGMGTVYRAEHLVLRAPVAVKVIDREVSEGDVALSRFMREAQAAASLRSPHVVQILDYGMEGQRAFMVMELLEGETLAARIERLGRLTPGETYRVMSHIARAVAKAHEAGIVHRDLKPDNVFLVHNEGDEIAKVLDFGVAKVDTTSLGGHSHTRTGSLLGTPYYMSPEQAQGNKEIDHRSDLWALGVIAFECLLGVRPFSSEGLGDLVIQICIRDIPIPSEWGLVPEGFDAWFARAVTREPELRFQSARELSDALRGVLGIEREHLGSIPESAWSIPAAIPPFARREAEDGANDELRTIVEPATRTTESNRGELPAARGPVTFVDQELPRVSQWAIVPHESGQEPSIPSSREPGLRSVSASSRAVSEPAASRSRGASLVWVGLIALVVGSGGVFLLNQAGVALPGLSESDEEPTPDEGEADEPAPSKRKAAPPSNSSGNSEGAVAPMGSGGAHSSPGEPTGGGEGLERAGDSANAPGGAEGEPRVPSDLDAIEADAEKQLLDRRREEGSSSASSAEGTSGKKAGGTGGAPAVQPSSSPSETAPRPELPEGLRPVPPIPGPASP